MGDRTTWHFDSGGLVGWNFRPMARSDGPLVRLDLDDRETRRRWICDLVGHLSELLGDFARPHKVHVHTNDKGYDACVVDWQDVEGPSTLLAFLRQAETWVVDAWLDLTCLDRDLDPLEIADGAHFMIKVDLTNSGALDHRTDAPVYVRLELNADIYAPWSLGEIQNNALLAALNGPRLAGLLERIERDVPAELLEIHQDHHPRGTVGPRGFKGAGNDDRGHVA